jgi:hypothetical protein
MGRKNRCCVRNTFLSIELRDTFGGQVLEACVITNTSQEERRILPT